MPPWAGGISLKMKSTFFSLFSVRNVSRALASTSLNHEAAIPSPTYPLSRIMHVMSGPATNSNPLIHWPSDMPRQGDECAVLKVYEEGPHGLVSSRHEH